MSERVSIDEQIIEVERLIETFRWARAYDVPEGLTYRALKQVATDLRARLPGTASDAANAIERRIEDANRSKTHLGYAINALRGLGEELIGRWPTIRHALEEQEKRR